MVDAAVLGASGYAGGELLRLLAAHPNVRLSAAVSETYAGKPLSAGFPGLDRISEPSFTSMADSESLILNCGVVFLASGNGKAMHLAPRLLEAGCSVVDLSADFRFKNLDTYRNWYGQEHASKQINEEAVYGLPELFGDQLKNARIVGNPGCYPTAAILALAPLLKFQLADPTTIIVDAKSGVSGAGRSNFMLDFHYPEVNENVSAYKIAGTHRHTPEIEEVIASFCGLDEFLISFTPHLIPMSRGILATCYASLTSDITASELTLRYADFYSNAPFVSVWEDRLPSTKGTLGSNECHIGLAVDKRTRKVTIVSAIDNLMKGAAGQAVQNMNLMLGFEETSGLESGGLWP